MEGMSRIVTYKQLALRLGVKVEDLRSLLRAAPGVPPEAIMRKAGGGSEETFSDREAPEAFAQAMLAAFGRATVKGSSRVRLRALQQTDISAAIQQLVEATATEPPPAEETTEAAQPAG